MDKSFTIICALDSRAEGKTLSDVLTSHGIHAEVVRHLDLPPQERRDTLRGWGSLRVDSEDVTRAVEIVERWRQREPEAVQRQRERDRERHRETVRRSRQESREEGEFLEEREIPDKRRREQR